MASVNRRTAKDGKPYYQVQWSMYDAQGQRHRKTKVFQKLADAKKHSARVEIEHERRGISDPDKVTFAQLVSGLVEHWKVTRLEDTGSDIKPMSITTLSSYQRNLETLCKEIGKLEISKLTVWHIEQAYAALRVSGGVSRKRPKDGEERKTRPLSKMTLRHIHRVGFLAMKHAVRRKLVSENPFAHVDCPSPDKRVIRIPTDDEIVRVFRAATKAHERGKHPGGDLAVALLYTCGIRRSELLGLAVDAVDFDTGAIAIFRTVVAGPKGEAILRDHRTKSAASERTIVLPPELLPMLTRHRAWLYEMALQWGPDYRRDPFLLFPTFGGDPLMPRAMTERLRQYQRTARVYGVQPTHGFRHGLASQLVAAGTDIKTVAERLGHSTPAFTLATYVKPVNGQDAKAAQLMGTKFKALSDKAKTA